MVDRCYQAQLNGDIGSRGDALRYLDRMLRRESAGEPAETGNEPTAPEANRR